MRKILSSLLLITFLLGCEPVGRGLPEEFNKSGQEMHLTVVFHPTLADLKAAYRDHAPEDTDEGLLGYSFWKQGSDPHVCEIHAVKPQRDGDERMMTMGHELLHCMIGKYHN